MRARGLVLVLLCVASAAAQESAPPAPERDAAVAALVADTRSAPPEFAADVLLRLSGAARVDTAWRREILEEAYLRAYAAAESYRFAAASATPIDSRQNAQAIASSTALTRVSLQVRAAELMASVEPARAREMFEWIDLDLAS